LFLKARKLAVGAAVHDAQSGFLSNFLDFEFATRQLELGLAFFEIAWVPF
jgi:hypothetical protein